MNRLACLRLVERCADALISVKEEMSESQSASGTDSDLIGPIGKLER